MKNPKLAGATDGEMARLAVLGVPKRMQPFIDTAKRFLDSFSPGCFLGVLTLAEKQFQEQGPRIMKPEAVIATIFCDVVEAATVHTKRSVISGWWEAPATQRLRVARQNGALAKKAAQGLKKAA